MSDVHQCNGDWFEKWLSWGVSTLAGSTISISLVVCPTCHEWAKTDTQAHDESKSCL